MIKRHYLICKACDTKVTTPLGDLPDIPDKCWERGCKGTSFTVVTEHEEMDDEEKHKEHTMSEDDMEIQAVERMEKDKHWRGKR